jgi:hypothetical protein
VVLGDVAMSHPKPGGDGMDVRLRYANLVTIEGGMVARNVGFADWQSALEAAGLRE